MSRMLLQLCAFLRRDAYVYRERIVRFIFNYAFLYAVMYGLCFGYLLPKIGMSVSVQTFSATVMFVGLLLFALSGCAFAINGDFLFDSDKDQLTNYYLTIVPYWFIIIEKIIFGSVLLFLCMVPYYIFMKLCFFSTFDLSHMSLIKVLIILYLSCLYAMTFSIMFACIVKYPVKQIRHFYRRIHFPMIVLGGVLVPWKAIAKFSTLLGYIVLINPLIYVTEGLRHSFLGGDYFFTFWVCVSALIIFTLIALTTACIFFRRKADPI